MNDRIIVKQPKFVLPSPLVPDDVTPEQMRKAAEMMTRDFPTPFKTDKALDAMATLLRAASLSRAEEFSSGVQKREILPSENGDRVFLHGVIEFKWEEFHEPGYLAEKVDVPTES